MPRSAQRENRLYTLFQCPYSAGSSRHWAPERLIHRTPAYETLAFRFLPNVEACASAQELENLGPLFRG